MEVIGGILHPPPRSLPPNCWCRCDRAICCSRVNSSNCTHQLTLALLSSSSSPHPLRPHPLHTSSCHALTRVCVWAANPHDGSLQLSILKRGFRSPYQDSAPTVILNGCVLLSRISPKPTVKILPSRDFRTARIPPACKKST